MFANNPRCVCQFYEKQERPPINHNRWFATDLLRLVDGIQICPICDSFRCRISISLEVAFSVAQIKDRFEQPFTVQHMHDPIFVISFDSWQDVDCC